MVVDASTLERVGAMSKAQLALWLRKILYGLKQAGRLWAQHLRATLLKLGFKQCFTDCCIYKRGSGMDLTIVGVYVDDLLVTGSSEENGSKFFDEMAVLNVKGLGFVLWFLGMGATYNEEDGYMLEQRQTIQELLDRFGLAEANSVRVPISDDQDEDAESELLPNSGMASLPTRLRAFQSLVGSLLWIARCTTPDIAFAVHRVTRRAHAPVEAEWRRAQRIARYLKGTIGFKLYLTGAAGLP
ncbi:hypothetical protein PI125_g23740 [Phytophthora idaei]|nr:hypothetical protein PI125_g23740 [Phytophthora idaei]